MNKIFCILITLVIGISNVRALSATERDSVNVYEVLSKLPIETNKFDKLVLGRCGFYYLVIVNDTVQSQYFAHPDSTISYLEVERINCEDEVEKPNLSQYFESKENILASLSEDVERQISTIGYPVSVAYVEEGHIKSYKSFQSFTIYPVPFELFIFFLNQTGYLICDKYERIESKICLHGYRWLNSQ